MKMKNVISKNLVISFFGGVLGAFVVLLIFFGIYGDKFSTGNHKLVEDYKNYVESKTELSTSTRQVLFDNMSIAGAPADFTIAAERALPAVVHIKTQFNQPNYTLYDFIFGTPPRNFTPVISSGSGVILSQDGYIVTNNHVIENAETIEVILNNRKEFPAKIIGRDPTTDIALLKVDANNLPAITIGDSDSIRVGEWVLAIGNPFNLTSTATAGIVSALARNLNILSDNLAIESFIQTDAAVNPGNSGGALVNLKGELIGINTAIASRTGSFVGYSFAIPVSIVRKVVADLIEFGEVQRAYAGFEIVDVTSEIARKFNLDGVEGVYVARVLPNGAADKAGMKEGDVILGVNSARINSTTELLEQISRFRPGDNVKIVAKRGKFPKVFELQLQNKYGEVDFVHCKNIEVLGAKFEPVPENLRTRLRLRNGVQIVDIYPGKFAANGVRRGYIITKINNTVINTVEDIEKSINESDGSLFIEGVYPNGTVAYYAFRI